MIALYDKLATLVLLLHALWIVWVVCGPFVARGRRRLRAAHIGCVAATLIVHAAGVCPLTTLENFLKQLAGRSGYEGGFIEHYTALFVYGDLVTFPPAAMVVGLAFIAAVSLWVYLHGPLTEIGEARKG